jgi:hypothetical protein
MLSTMNVMIGAILSVVVALSPVFSIHGPADLAQVFVFIGALLLLTANIHAATYAIRLRWYVFLLTAIIIFLFMEATFLIHYTLGPVHMPTGEYVIQFQFSNIEYVWVFILLTWLWFTSSLIAALCDRDWLTQ